MAFEFDAAKEKANQVKHGVSLAIVESLEWDAALVWPDERFEYDELRMNAIVPKEIFWYHVSYVERGDTMRVISVRRANRREIDFYAANY